MTDSSSSAARPGTRVVIRFARRAGLLALFIVAALLGTLGGLVFVYADDIASISAPGPLQAEHDHPADGADGQQIGEFATERRVVIRYDDIAPVLRQAIIASEDAEFESHFGISLVAPLRDRYPRSWHRPSHARRQHHHATGRADALPTGLHARRRVRAFGDRGLERKIKEWLIAFQLEKRYTKNEILAFYANHVPLDHGAYGVEAAARMYFDKSAKDLTSRRQRLSSRSSRRRHASARSAIRNRTSRDATPTCFVAWPRRDTSPARRPPRPPSARSCCKGNRAAGVRRTLLRRGNPQGPRAEVRRRRALSSRTPRTDHARRTLQEAANLALDRGLRRIDKRRSGYRKPRVTCSPMARTSRRSVTTMVAPILAGDIVPAVVTFVPAPKERGNARVRIASHEIDLPPAAFRWTRRTSPASLFKVGDLIEVEVRELDGDVPRRSLSNNRRWSRGRLLAIDNETGQVRAMAGGFDFARSKFNRATQARRQVGSLFKPIVYTAAIDRGFTPVSIFVDEPVSVRARTESATI